MHIPDIGLFHADPPGIDFRLTLGRGETILAE